MAGASKIPTSGAIVRVQITSDTLQGPGVATQLTPGLLSIFTPASVAGCVLWLRGDIGVSGVASVTTWSDKSGNGNDATPTGTGPAPMTLGQNGRSYLRFGGSATMTGPLPVFPANAVQSVFVVARVSGNSQGVIAGTVGSTANTGWSVLQSGGATIGRDIITGDSSGTPPGNVVAIYALTAKSAQGILYLNGIAQTTAAGSSPDNGPPTTYSLGALAPSGLFPLVGDIYEVAVFDHVLSASDFKLVNEYLGSRYAISVP